jgi:hypothetical protein
VGSTSGGGVAAGVIKFSPRPVFRGRLVLSARIVRSALVSLDSLGGVIPCARLLGGRPAADPHAARPVPTNGGSARAPPRSTTAQTAAVEIPIGAAEPGSAFVLPTEDGAPRVPVGVGDTAGSLSPSFGLR